MSTGVDPKCDCGNPLREGWRCCQECGDPLLSLQDAADAQKKECAPVHAAFGRSGGACHLCGYDILPVGYMK